MKEGDGKIEKGEAVRRFLEVFDGDSGQAIRQLQDYIDNTGYLSDAIVRPKTPVLLSVKNMQKTYKIGKQRLDVLRDINLTIHEGEFVAITGASGSGKSTLLQLMGGLDKPSSGEVYFGDTNIAKLSDRNLSEFRRQTVGFVFQFFYLQPFLKLEQNLAVPGMFAHLQRSQRQARIYELAERVGLTDRLSHYPKELSGGQMQRAAIARALLNQPKILLADEPTGNLDSQNSAAIITLFEEIRKEMGTTIVVVTHDKEIARRADRRIVIHDGAIA